MKKLIMFLLVLSVVGSAIVAEGDRFSKNLRLMKF